MAKEFPKRSGKMATHVNHMLTQSLQRQLDQVANVVEEELLLLNDPTQFHTLEII
jgi:hypothetical protein